MDISARQNKLANIMLKIEKAQNWNKIAFLISFGAVLHACTWLGSDKKMGCVDYASVPATVLSVKKALSLASKEEKSRKLWSLLQQKSANRS